MKKLVFAFLLITHGVAASVFVTQSPNSLIPKFPTSPTPVSFEVVRGIVLVQADLNSSPGTFILDTGSTMMILNEQVGEAAEVQANSLQGGLDGHWKTCDFSWAGLHKFNVDALAADISHLEKLTGRTIDGLIGYKFFDDFDLLLDFDNQQVTLVPPGSAAIGTDWVLKSKLPFELVGHLPVIQAKIGDATFRFGLDTGAGVNLCDLRRKPEIDPAMLTPVQKAGVVGLAGSQEIVVADITETNIGGLHFWNMRFAFGNISDMHNLVDNGVDGLLGYPFFEGRKFSINYKDKVLVIGE